jgi:acyl-CoA thioesterase I
MPAGAGALAGLLLGGMLSLASLSPARAEDPVRIVALGDSLTAGYGLPASAAFPVRLQKALAGKGVAVEISNAGVSGDTTSDGLSRLDWSVPEGTEAVILELGANDMLRGLDPQVTRNAMQEILRRLRERRIAVLVCGMIATANLGPDYVRSFNSIFPELAAANHLPIYPFFLAGVAGSKELNQPDGLHPTAAGVDAIVARILPTVEELVQQVRRQRGH